jgi:hypothetical protein
MPKDDNGAVVDAHYLQEGEAVEQGMVIDFPYHSEVVGRSIDQLGAPTGRSQVWRRAMDSNWWLMRSPVAIHAQEGMLVVVCGDDALRKTNKGETET